MRKKYNLSFSDEIVHSKSYIRKFLGSEMELLLCPDSDSLRNIDFKSIYVNNPEVEDQLTPFLSSTYSDQCLFLTGLTGCGKSSILRFFFSLERNIPIIQNDSLIIPFTFDHNITNIASVDHVITYFSNVVKSACEVIKRTFPGLDREYQNQIKFYDYAFRIRPDLLQYNCGIVTDPKEQSLINLYNNSSFEYNALYLKYCLDLVKVINNVVIIVDDIESIGYNKELIPIDCGLSLWTCLKNQPSDSSFFWRSNIVIGCRHYVYRMIKSRCIESEYQVSTQINGQTLESYPIDNEISINEPRPLIEIIRRRADALFDNSKSEKWKTAFGIVQSILINVESRYGDLILSLNDGNVRKSLQCLKRVVENSRWIQREFTFNELTDGAFSIRNIDQYNLSSPCLIRALGLNEGLIYQEDSIIPNLLYNSDSGEMDLITLLLFKMLIMRTRNSAQNWRHSLSRTDIISSFVENISIDNIENNANASFDYLILKRLLYRSKNQAQNDGADISADNVSSIQNVYVSSAASRLWELLGESSVLFEMYMDDVWVDSTFPFQQKRSFSMFDSINFDRCIKYLFSLIQQEVQIRTAAKNRGILDQYCRHFGNKMVTAHLYRGLSESIRAYYRNSPAQHSKDIEQLNNELYEAKKRGLVVLSFAQDTY